MLDFFFINKVNSAISSFITQHYFFCWRTPLSLSHTHNPFTEHSSKYISQEENDWCQYSQLWRPPKELMSPVSKGNPNTIKQSQNNNRLTPGRVQTFDWSAWTVRGEQAKFRGLSWLTSWLGHMLCLAHKTYLGLKFPHFFKFFNPTWE